MRVAQAFTNQKPVDSVSNGTRLNEEQQAEFEGFTYIPDAANMSIAAGDGAGEGEGAGERRKSQCDQHVHTCPRPWRVPSAALEGGTCPQSHRRLLHRACPFARAATDGKASERQVHATCLRGARCWKPWDIVLPRDEHRARKSPAQSICLRHITR